LQAQIDSTKEQESIINRLRARVEVLEREKTEVQTQLNDSKAEKKIALESMEKERREKDEVFTLILLNTGITKLCAAAH